jgi:cytochrome c-type biogenesis protein CcmF
MFLGAWVLMGVVIDLAQRTGRGPNRLRRLFRLPGADWGKATAHAGFGITMLGVAGIYAWTVEDIRVAQLDVPFEVHGYEMVLRSVDNVNGPNYVATRAIIDVAHEGEFLATLAPEKRFYPVAQMPTTEAAIHQNWKRDLYLVIGDEQDNGGWAVRTYIKPFANWLWMGCALMALGGILSLSDRRYRVAAGAKKRTSPNAVPAE